MREIVGQKIRPTKAKNISLTVVLVALAVNLAVAIITMTVATPIYNHIKENGQALPEDMSKLMGINLLRLILSTLSNVVVIYMLFVLIQK